jgi:prepilin-type N-terminal cleavage/methylation domain-containing protein
MISIQKQRGFTLVEIAIVLVIIGLLLGGILKGQELITSARVRNLADQNSGIQAAYYGFIDRYRQIPGDMQAALAIQAIGSSVPAGIGGDGNGRLNDDDWGEASALWVHLSRANFIQGNYAGGAADDGTYVAQTVSPINAFNGRVMLTRTQGYYDANATPSYRLALFLGNQIPVNVMRELDVKVDDSAPQTGVLRATKGTTVGEVNYSTPACIDTTGTPIWDIDANEQDCGAIYLY